MRIDVAYFQRLFQPILARVLEDAERIDPHISSSKASHCSDRVSEGFGQC